MLIPRQPPGLMAGKPRDIPNESEAVQRYHLADGDTNKNVPQMKKKTIHKADAPQEVIPPTMEGRRQARLKKLAAVHRKARDEAARNGGGR